MLAMEADLTVVGGRPTDWARSAWPSTPDVV